MSLVSPAFHPTLTRAFAFGGGSGPPGVHPGGGPGGSSGPQAGAPSGSGCLFDFGSDWCGSRRWFWWRLSRVPASFGAPGRGGIVFGGPEGPATFKGTVGNGIATGISAPSIPTLIVTDRSAGDSAGSVGVCAGVALLALLICPLQPYSLEQVGPTVLEPWLLLPRLHRSVIPTVLVMGTWMARCVLWELQWWLWMVLSKLILLAVALTPLLALAVDKVQLWVRMVVMMWLLALLWQLHPLLLKMGVVAARAGSSALGAVRGIRPGGLAFCSGVCFDGAGDAVGTGGGV